MSSAREEIESVINAAQNLCNALEKNSQRENMFCQNICYTLETYSWDMYKLANELREIKYYAGV
jgi:hypothetical protein